MIERKEAAELIPWVLGATAIALLLPDGWNYAFLGAAFIIVFMHWVGVDLDP